jgi:hypothetical protein
VLWNRGLFISEALIMSLTSFLQTIIIFHFRLKILRKNIVFKCSDYVKGNFDYFAHLNNQFDELFFQQLFSYVKNEVELTHFILRIMRETDIKIEMMDDCKELWLLFLKRRLRDSSKDM